VEEEHGGVMNRFNKTNDNIEWAGWSWNPVTGCMNTCEYCYARDIATRFHGGFEPTFHPDRLDAPKNTKPSPDNNKVFVCSMADLFGPWVQREWINSILLVVEENPQWVFIFLTKYPENLMPWIFPVNAWIGATADTQKRYDKAVRVFKRKLGSVRFLSMEPLLEYIETPSISVFDWLIIGARSKNSKLPEFQPDIRWVLDITNDAHDHGVKVYWKPNLTVRPKEYPQEC
jgi:protein gp37